MHGIIKNTSNRESREKHEKWKNSSFAYFCVFRGKIFVFILPEIFMVLIGEIKKSKSTDSFIVVIKHFFTFL